MYVLAERFGLKWLASIFAAFCACAAFGIGNMTQANTVVTGLANSYGIPAWLSGSVLAALTALVVVGGIRRIAAVVSVLVPAMCGLYMVCALVVLIANVDALGSVVGQILKSAFTGHAAMGGFAGASVRGMMQTGVARGLFSNEAGMGSAPIVHAAAGNGSSGPPSILRHFRSLRRHYHRLQPHGVQRSRHRGLDVWEHWCRSH